MYILTGIVIAALVVLSVSPVCANTIGISKDGRYFTINGVPTFLNGISYYAGTSANASFVSKDLDDIKARRMNWIRVWTFWGGKDESFAVLTPEGQPIEPYMGRLKHIITECDKCGIIVDVTMSHGKNPVPSNQKEHLACALELAKELKPYRNVYIDVSNERDVGDARFVSIEDVGALVAGIKSVDPARICTASATPGSLDDVKAFLTTGRLDFVCPHLCRDPECPSQTLGTVHGIIGWMNEMGRRVPVHLQEPLRRGYTGFEPSVEDFFRDCTGGKIAGAAGWCLHNGSTRGKPDGKPRRSFGMTDADGRLFDQLDDIEKAAAKDMDDQIGGVAVSTLRYQAEYDEQVTHEVGHKDGFAWRVDLGIDKAGSMASATRPDVPAGKCHVTWRLIVEGDCAADAAVATIEVRSGSEVLASKALHRRDFKGVGAWQEFSLDAKTAGPGPLEMRAQWPGACAVKMDWVTLIAKPAGGG